MAKQGTPHKVIKVLLPWLILTDCHLFEHELVLRQSASFVTEKVLNLTHLFMHTQILNLESLSSFNVVKHSVSLHEHRIVDLHHLQNNDELKRNELVEQQVI